MPFFCCVYGCNNTSDSKGIQGKSITFHGVPLNDKYRIKQWLVNMRRKNFDNIRDPRICSEHFLDEDFKYSDSNKKLLKNTAVPRKFGFTGTRTHLNPCRNDRNIASMAPSFTTVLTNSQQNQSHTNKGNIRSTEVPQKIYFTVIDTSQNLYRYDGNIASLAPSLPTVLTNSQQNQSSANNVFIKKYRKLAPSLPNVLTNHSQQNQLRVNNGIGNIQLDICQPVETTSTNDKSTQTVADNSMQTVNSLTCDLLAEIKILKSENVALRDALKKFDELLDALT